MQAHHEPTAAFAKAAAAEGEELKSPASYNNALTESGAKAFLDHGLCLDSVLRDAQHGAILLDAPYAEKVNVFTRVLTKDTITVVEVGSIEKAAIRRRELGGVRERFGPRLELGFEGFPLLCSFEFSGHLIEGK